MTRFRNDSVALSEVLDVLDRRRTVLNVVVLDACRNNPLATSRSFGGAGLRGVQQADLGGETIIGFATAPGGVAADGSGRLSPYTQALSEVLGEASLSLWEVFGEVGARVERATRESANPQRPWKNDNLRKAHYLAKADAVPPVPAAPVVPPGIPGAQTDIELTFWTAADSCGTRECLQAYLEKYPNGEFAVLARARIAPSPTAPSSGLVAFTVKTMPADALVRIMNIQPRYRDGMALKPGRYRVEVSKPGYMSQTLMHELSAQTPTLEVTLAKSESRNSQSRLTAPVISGDFCADMKMLLAHANERFAHPAFKETGMDSALCAGGGVECRMLNSDVYNSDISCEGPSDRNWQPCARGYTGPAFRQKPRDSEKFTSLKGVLEGCDFGPRTVRKIESSYGYVDEDGQEHHSKWFHIFDAQRSVHAVLEQQINGLGDRTWEREVNLKVDANSKLHNTANQIRRDLDDPRLEGKKLYSSVRQVAGPGD